MEDIMEQKLQRAVSTFGITLDDTAMHRFEIYCEQLISMNQVMNLTAITDPDEI